MATTTTNITNSVDEEARGGINQGGCWGKVLDLGEAKQQILIILPLVLAYVFCYSMTMVSIMFAGHLGELELAGSALANSLASVTGFGLMTGLSGALETLCGQAFGAKLYKELGVYLQTSCLISFLVCIIVSVIWLFTKPILILLRQEPEVASAAALYIKYLIPGLFAFGFVQNIMRFCQAQGIIWPLVFFTGVPFGIHFGLLFFMVNRTSLGFIGSPSAASISIGISLVSLVMFVILSKRFEKTWKGLSLESFGHILRILRLALPSAAMVCLEYGAFEVLVILAGLMPNPKIRSSLIAICLNIEMIVYMIAYGLSAAASVRVSNELGAGKPGRAKHAMLVALKLSILLALAAGITIVFGHNIWANFFTDSPLMIKKFASMSSLLAVSIALDTIQCVLSGVTRGCGWQHIAAGANLGCFYMFGLPISILLGFRYRLHTLGLWTGLICGLSCQTIILLLITFCRKWTQVDLSTDNEDEETSNNA